MSNNENIYDEWRRTLDGLGLQSDERSQQKARVVAARAQIDQAISLATIADGLDQLVAHFTGRPADAPATEQEVSDYLRSQPARPGSILTEHDVEVGDLVSPVGGPREVTVEVAEIGTDQGDVWLKFAGQPDTKVWASQFVVVERSLDAIEQRLDATEPVMTMEDAAAIDGRADDLDDDFAAAPSDADEQQADALAALRARQGKGKKGGQKR